MFTVIKNLFRRPVINPNWNLVVPTKRGGSYSIYFGEKHIANVRGKTKALVLAHALAGIDITDKLTILKK